MALETPNELQEKLRAWEIPQAKSLMWLALNFPMNENPADNSDKLCNCIHMYCLNGYKTICEQNKEITELKEYVKTLEDKLMEG